MAAHDAYRARRWRPDRWEVERELPCINGLSAWFSICSINEPDESEVGYSDGLCGTAEENANRIADALNAAQRTLVLETAIKTACDLLAERMHGNPARSPGHNARLELEAALKSTAATEKTDV